MEDYEKVIKMLKSSWNNVMKLESFEQTPEVNMNVVEVNEAMINEHKAKRDTFERNIAYSGSEMEDVILKIQKVKTFNLFESDTENIKRILQDKKTIIEKNWQEKYDIMKQDFDFHVYKMEQSSRIN
jgi:hypothetical protein